MTLQQPCVLTTDYSSSFTPTSVTNRRYHKISVFIRPIPSSSSFLPSLCNSLLFCLVLSLISLWYSLSANGACLQGAHQIHYQVGQRFPRCFTHNIYYMEGGKEEENISRRDGGKLKSAIA